MGKFKIITAESYFQPSIPPGLMVAEGDYVRPATLLDFLQPLDAIQLGDGVPGEVADLFEVAKGASAYGYLYWPLFTVGAHYAILALEAALYEKHRRNGGQDRNATMGVTIHFLERKGLLPESQIAKGVLCHRKEVAGRVLPSEVCFDYGTRVPRAEAQCGSHQRLVRGCS